MQNRLLMFVLISCLLIGNLHAAEEYSAPVDIKHPTNVYWGDTHLHTRNSPDAWSMGNLHLTPHDAYRFAQGHAVTAHNGMKVKLKRPFDFLVISDHSEYLGAYYRFNMKDPLVTETTAGRMWQKFVDDTQYQG